MACVRCGLDAAFREDTPIGAVFCSSECQSAHHNNNNSKMAVIGASISDNTPLDWTVRHTSAWRTIPKNSPSNVGVLSFRFHIAHVHRRGSTPWNFGIIVAKKHGSGPSINQEARRL